MPIFARLCVVVCAQKEPLTTNVDQIKKNYTNPHTHKLVKWIHTSCNHILNRMVGQKARRGDHAFDCAPNLNWLLQEKCLVARIFDARPRNKTTRRRFVGDFCRSRINSDSSWLLWIVVLCVCVCVLWIEWEDNSWRRYAPVRTCGKNRFFTYFLFVLIYFDIEIN